MHNLVNSWFSVVLAVAFAAVAVWCFIPKEDDSTIIRYTKYALGANFAVSSYMLVGPPIVIETDLSWYPGRLAGLSSGPLILIDNSWDWSDEVKRHEYQHFCQQAVLTPLFSGVLSRLNFLINLIIYRDWHEAYLNTWHERDARLHQTDGMIFDYILWRSSQLSFETSEVVNYE